MSSRLPALAALGALLVACTNNPYPDADAERKVRYRTLEVPPKTLDPAVSYSVNEHHVTASVYETLLEYHYLKRPYTLIPGLAEAVPAPEPQADGGSLYRFRLRDGIGFASDECFAHFHGGPPSRPVVAADVAFQLMRLADPAVGSPMAPNFGRIRGFQAFGERLTQLRADPEFAALRIDRQYRRAGGIPGVAVRGERDLEVALASPHPQILYWFAFPFTTPVAWEAVAYWNGEGGRDFFKDHPVGTGPFRVGVFDKHRRIVLERNENWYGARHPERRAPGATFPDPAGLGAELVRGIDPAYAGRPLPFLDAVEFRVEKERIPEFSKFLQGYYDDSLITKESFDRVVHDGGLSPDMAARGVRLRKAVDIDVWYVGFNMLDPVVGAPAGERGRGLRQAMSLAVDAREFTRLFSNGRGVPAQSPIPPGLFGYDPGYRNPYRQPDLERARRILAEAGYPGGLDPATGRPLVLRFDALDPSTSRLMQFQFLADTWAKLGLEVRIVATTYNQFRDKLERGVHQVYLWGWLADYPDPENFLFLLWGPNAHSLFGGPNYGNFQDADYDALFVEMRDRPDDARRLERIREMRELLERERPWIELFHREQVRLEHEWLRNLVLAGVVGPTDKYLDVDPARRGELRRRWNEPIVWPAWVLAALGAAVVAPGVRTYLRERS